MHPDLEVVQIRRGESFKAWAHGYPFRTVRWHFHPEYEIHHVVATTGRYFVGDFIGEFEPGNLVLTGPNLPHNWISDVPAGSCVPLRGRIVQFSEALVAQATAAFPEFAACAGVLELSRHGALFPPATAAIVGPLLAELVEAQGMRRIPLFMGIMGALSRAGDVRSLTSAGYLPDPSGFMAAGINEALAYIDGHLTEPFSESDLAAIAGRTPSAFSRSFRRHTGMALVQYVKRLRINLACQLLMSEAELPVTEICYAVGYNNISNFNRQFLAQKGMPPSRFRALLAENVAVAEAACSGEGGTSIVRSGRRARFQATPRNEHARRLDAVRSAPGLDPNHNPKGEDEMTQSACKLTGAALALGLMSGTSAFAQGADNATVAFLMPDQASTRYEERDYPGFEAEMKKLCPNCTVIYQNANADVALQQQQFNSVISQGATVIVLDPVDSSAAASLVEQAHSQNVKVIAYDRPIPDTPADYYVSFDNQGIGKAIAQSLVDHLKAEGVADGSGVLQINGSPTDAAAGLIRDGIDSALDASAYKTLAEFDTPDWAPPEAQQWASGQITRFGDEIKGVVAANDGTAGGAIAAFKAAGVEPVPPVTGNDATIAALQLIIAGDQYNTISKPSEIVAAAAANIADQFISGKTPEAKTTLYDTPSELFVPAVITAENIKAEIFDKGVTPVAEVCTGDYVEACDKMGIK